jgi:hypothetical protein
METRCFLCSEMLTYNNICMYCILQIVTEMRNCERAAPDLLYSRFHIQFCVSTCKVFHVAFLTPCVKKIKLY